MNIEEAISRLAEAKEGSVLVARPPLTWGAEALFVELTEDYRVPDSIKEVGFEYLLGVEDLANLTLYLGKKRLSQRAAAEFVIHYALNDCAPAWIDDIPNL